MTRLGLILALLLALAAGPAPGIAATAAHDCCCVPAACACPVPEADEMQCDECGPATPADEAPASSAVARVVVPQPSLAITAGGEIAESAAIRTVAPAPRHAGRSLLALLSILRV